MSTSDQETRTLAELKKDLEEKIAKAEKELAFLKASLKLVDEALTRISFRPASRLVEETQKAPVEMPKPSIEPPAPQEQPFPIKSKTGEDLGIFYIGKNTVRIVPRPDLGLNLKTPPFQSFFLERVIGEMRKKDEMAVDAGTKDPDSIIEYNIKSDGDIIKEITILNVDEDSRVRELRSSIRWTFERMLEKMPR
ncbi:MAG: hypothetical protein NO482_01255 [Candidatus Methanomethylicia archaeon]|jgi:hypothetical protein|nr:hypothetical protein [Candidatus Methanomethylicia archaeon]